MYNTETRDKRKPIPENHIADDLIIGRTYIIMAQVYGLAKHSDNLMGQHAVEEPTKMTLIGLYPFGARFIRKKGYPESFDYWDLARRLVHG